MIEPNLEPPPALLRIEAAPWRDMCPTLRNHRNTNIHPLLCLGQLLFLQQRTCTRHRGPPPCEAGATNATGQCKTLSKQQNWSRYRNQLAKRISGVT